MTIGSQNLNSGDVLIISDQRMENVPILQAEQHVAGVKDDHLINRLSDRNKERCITVIECLLITLAVGFCLWSAINILMLEKFDNLMQLNYFISFAVDFISFAVNFIYGLNILSYGISRGYFRIRFPPRQ